jgi:hypothetical protein
MKITHTVFLLLVCFCVSNMQLPYPNEDVRAEIAAMDPAELARRRQKVTEDYLEMHGPDAAKIRECIMRISPGGSDPLKVEDFWVDKKLEKAGLYRIDEEAYIRWILNAKEGSKPWLLMIGWTPYGNPKENF